MANKISLLILFIILVAILKQETNGRALLKRSDDESDTECDFSDADDDSMIEEEHPQYELISESEQDVMPPVRADRLIDLLNDAPLTRDQILNVGLRLVELAQPDTTALSRTCIHGAQADIISRAIYRFLSQDDDPVTSNQSAQVATNEVSSQNQSSQSDYCEVNDVMSW